MEDKHTSPHKPVEGCRFCVENDQLKIIAYYPPDVPVVAATAVLVLAKDTPDDYLVIPGEHAETEDGLPDDFTAACKYLHWFIPWMEEATADPLVRGYHTGTNYGDPAGQTVWHVHQWYSLVPKGYRVPGIATHTRNDVRSQDALGLTLQELLDSSIVQVPDFATP